MLVGFEGVRGGLDLALARAKLALGVRKAAAVGMFFWGTSCLLLLAFCRGYHLLEDAEVDRDQLSREQRRAGLRRRGLLLLHAKQP